MFRVVPVPKLSLSKEVKEGVGKKVCWPRPPRFRAAFKFKFDALTARNPASRLKRARIWPTARLLKDFNYYFLVILAAPYHTHTLETEGTICGAKNVSNFVRRKITFGRRIFIAFQFKQSSKTTYIQQQTTTNSENKRFHHYNSISYCLFDNTVLGFYSHTQSEKISRSRHL